MQSGATVLASDWDVGNAAFTWLWGRGRFGRNCPPYALRGAELFLARIPCKDGTNFQSKKTKAEHKTWKYRAVQDCKHGVDVTRSFAYYYYYYYLLLCITVISAVPKHCLFLLSTLCIKGHESLRLALSYSSDRSGEAQQGGMIWCESLVLDVETDSEFWSVRSNTESKSCLFSLAQLVV